MNWQAAKTHCPAGHPLVPGNLRGGKRGHRECLTCHRERELARRRAKGAKPQGQALVCGRGHDLTLPGARRTSGNYGCATCHRENEKARHRAEPERLMARQTAWRREHRPETNARTQAWRAEGPNRNRGRIKGRYAEILRHDPCYIEPVSRGGARAADNLTAACRPCNVRKYAKPLLTYLLEAT
jgi:hypothetical protein